jgi:CHAT domain-containing protein
LIEKHEIVYLPSASVLKAIRAAVAQRKPPAGLLVALAAPEFWPGEWSPLPHSRTEAEKILAIVPAGETSLGLFGPDATREFAMGGKLSGFRVLHFATHAWNHPQYPELSGIVLTQKGRGGRKIEGFLRLQDIQNLVLPADLVVLSACETARGKEILGEGFLGLTQGFMYAGVATVIVSLWKVNDESTAALMERFYRALLIEKRSPGEALRTAQSWMARHERWHSPYYWAGFEVQGEWR